MSCSLLEIDRGIKVESESTSHEGFYEYYEAAGLKLPDIPMDFRDSLREWSFWFLATQPKPLPIDDYLMETVDELRSPVADQFALSHSGHGINSYSLNLRMAIGDLALLVQVAWGGAFGDASADAAKWNDTMLYVSEILDLFNLQSKPGWHQRKFLVTYSDFRMHGARLEMFEDGKWIPLIDTDNWLEFIDELEQHV